MSKTIDKEELFAWIIEKLQANRSIVRREYKDNKLEQKYYEGANMGIEEIAVQFGLVDGYDKI